MTDEPGTLRLISTDFDGTIFAEFHDPPVPASLQRRLQRFQDRGGIWVINTGRDMASLMEALARARVEVRPDYLVLVEREIYRHLDSRYVGLEEWNRRCASDHERLFARVRPRLGELCAGIVARFAVELYEDPWSPLCVVAQNPGDADAIERCLHAFCASMAGLTVVRNDVYIRFSHAAYNKGTALDRIREELEVAPGETFAAGDHLNDLPMLRRAHAAWLAAPANSVAPVKAAVEEQGGHLSGLTFGDGVEEALRRFGI